MNETNTTDGNGKAVATSVGLAGGEMALVPLGRSKHHWHSADACRELGLKVGDTIQGRETYGNGYWSEARITLLFLGRQKTVWDTQRRSNQTPDEWFDDGESANWCLDCREWSKLTPTTDEPANKNAVRPSREA